MICPGCKHDITPTPVTFTWWGGLFGPRLLSHVQCPGCTTRFNGKTGASNNHAIAIYLAIVGAITFAIVFVALTQLGCGGAAGPAYPASGECAARADKPADWCDGKITTLGVVYAEATDDGGQRVYFQDLENLDPKTRAPFLYWGSCSRCSLVEGQAYRGRLAKDGSLYGIVVDGRELAAGVLTYDERPYLSEFVVTETCGIEAPAHWQRPAGTEEDPRCVAGPDPRTWSLAGPSEQATLPPCNEHGSYANQSVHVAIKVFPARGMDWTFDEAATAVAHQFLWELNQNSAGIQFSEWDVSSGFELAITLTQHAGDPETDSAELTARSLSTGYAFSASSGDGWHSTWQDAIAALARDTLVYFVEGWHAATPCVKRDRTIMR